MKTAELTLADLAVSRPGASRVFLANGLDFCCGSKQPFAEACAAKGLDPDTLLREIDLAYAAPDDLSRWSKRPLPDLIGFIEDHCHARLPDDLSRWSKRPLPDLIGFIEDHCHARLKREIPELIALAAKVEDVHAGKPTCPRGLTAHLRQMHRAILEHLEKEEQVLFPAIRAGRGHGTWPTVHSLETEHEDHGKSLARLRELTADLTAPAEARPTWRALYRRLARLADELMDHVSLENHVLFPRALFE
jgi:regulator of cell morphogenesis and NO signaling